MLKIYDPQEVSASFAGIPLSGFGEDTFIEITNEAESFVDVVGVDGDVSRSKTGDRRATIKFTLMQTSETNDLLSALAELDDNTPGGAGVGALLIRDNSGRAMYEGPQSWIQKPPDVTFGKQAGPRVWTIRVARLIRSDNGN